MELVFNHTPTFPAPQGESTDYRTYGIDAPRDRDIKWTCQEVGCVHWHKGWVTAHDETTELGRGQAEWIRRESGRDFREGRTVHDGRTLTVFRFSPYQRCFQDHRTVAVAYTVKLGDFRAGQDRQMLRAHSRPQDFVEDWGEHQDTIAERVRKYLGNPEERKAG